MLVERQRSKDVTSIPKLNVIEVERVFWDDGADINGAVTDTTTRGKTSLDINQENSESKCSKGIEASVTFSGIVEKWFEEIFTASYTNNTNNSNSLTTDNSEVVI